MSYQVGFKSWKLQKEEKERTKREEREGGNQHVRLDVQGGKYAQQWIEGMRGGSGSHPEFFIIVNILELYYAIPARARLYFNFTLLYALRMPTTLGDQRA